MISFAEALMKFGSFCLTLVVISFFSFFYIIISFCCPLIRSPNGFSAQATFGFEHVQLTKGHWNVNENELYFLFVLANQFTLADIINNFALGSVRCDIRLIWSGLFNVTAIIRRVHLFSRHRDKGAGQELTIGQLSCFDLLPRPNSNFGQPILFITFFKGAVSRNSAKLGNYKMPLI